MRCISLVSNRNFRMAANFKDINFCLATCSRMCYLPIFQLGSVLHTCWFGPPKSCVLQDIINKLYRCLSRGKDIACLCHVTRAVDAPTHKTLFIVLHQRHHDNTCMTSAYCTTVIIIIPGQCLWCCHHYSESLQEFTWFTQ